MSADGYLILAKWDEEARVWVATSEDVMGLATEAATFEELLAKLDVVVPELLAENEEEPPLLDEYLLSLAVHRWAISLRSCARFSGRPGVSSFGKDGAITKSGKAQSRIIGLRWTARSSLAIPRMKC